MDAQAKKALISETKLRCQNINTQINVIKNGLSRGPVPDIEKQIKSIEDDLQSITMKAGDLKEVAPTIKNAQNGFGKLKDSIQKSMQAAQNQASRNIEQGLINFMKKLQQFRSGAMDANINISAMESQWNSIHDEGERIKGSAAAKSNQHFGQVEKTYNDTVNFMNSGKLYETAAVGELKKKIPNFRNQFQQLKAEIDKGSKNTQLMAGLVSELQNGISFIKGGFSNNFKQYEAKCPTITGVYYLHKERIQFTLESEVSQFLSSHPLAESSAPSKPKKKDDNSLASFVFLDSNGNAVDKWTEGYLYARATLPEPVIKLLGLKPDSTTSLTLSFKSFVNGAKDTRFQFDLNGVWAGRAENTIQLEILGEPSVEPKHGLGMVFRNSVMAKQLGDLAVGCVSVRFTLHATRKPAEIWASGELVDILQTN